MDHVEMNVDPTDLQPGDVVLSLGDHEESDCHCDVVVRIKRPVSSDPPKLPTTSRNAGALSPGDIVTGLTTAAEPERITSIQHISATRRLIRVTGVKSRASSEARVAIYLPVTLVAEAAFCGPGGWVPPRDCPRCSRMFRNWLDCTCQLTCGRPLDCGGLR